MDFDLLPSGFSHHFYFVPVNFLARRIIYSHKFYEIGILLEEFAMFESHRTVIGQFLLFFTLAILKLHRCNFLGLLKG